MITTEELYKVYKNYSLISTDTRNIIPGSVFFALKGPSFNGNIFAKTAIEKGAAFAVIDEEKYQQGPQYLLTENVLTALQNLSNHHRHHLSIPFLAITGSNGKTTTKELVKNVLSSKFRVLATKGNLNNHIGVPLTILSIQNDIQFAVIEMGANHLQEISSYCNIAEPDYGLITNVGKAHLEGFGGFEGVKKGKGELYEWISRNGKGVFLNIDSGDLSVMAEKNKIENVIRYGTNGETFCKGKLISDQPYLTVEWKCGENSGKIQSQLTGAYNFENILSAVCIGNFFGVGASDIDRAIGSYVPDNSRSQIVKKGSNTIILDAYNANPTSMEAALVNFSKMTGENKIVFLGDMAELGEESVFEHNRILEILSEQKYETVVLVGPVFGSLKNDLNAILFPDSAAAAEWMKKNPVNNRSVLIKGSRSMMMEKILDAID